jgi:hypothetical protein
MLARDDFLDVHRSNSIIEKLTSNDPEAEAVADTFSVVVSLSSRPCALRFTLFKSSTTASPVSWHAIQV